MNAITLGAKLGDSKQSNLSICVVVSIAIATFAGGRRMEGKGADLIECGGARSIRVTTLCNVSNRKILIDLRWRNDREQLAGTGWQWRWASFCRVRLREFQCDKWGRDCKGLVVDRPSVFSIRRNR